MNIRNDDPEEVWIRDATAWDGRANGSAVPLVVMGVVVAAIAALWLGSVAVALRSPAVALFGVCVVAVIALSLLALIARFTVKRRQFLRFTARPDGVSFGAYAGHGALRALGPVAALMLGSMVWLLLRGELYGPSPASALFTGSTRIGAIVPAAIAVLLIVTSVRAWRTRTTRRLTLHRDGIDLVLPRTGGAATWDQIRSTAVGPDGVTIATGGGANLSWRVRDLDSDPALLAALVDRYAKRPADRQELEDGAAAVIREGSFI